MDGGHNLIELLENEKSILKAREYVNFLYEHGYLSRSSSKSEKLKKQLFENIDSKSKITNIYITKPFRTCDSMSETLYYFMKSLSRNVINLGEDENQSTRNS